MVPTIYYVLLSAILFSIGAIGVLTRRNVMVIFMSVELMLNSANLALVAFSRQWGNVDGQSHDVLRYHRRCGRGRGRPRVVGRYLPHQTDDQCRRC